MELFDQVKELIGPFIDAQRYMDTYGIVTDEVKQEEKSALSALMTGEPLVIVKFSIPEKWDIDDAKSIDPEVLKKTFKSKFNDGLKTVWKAQDDWDDESLDECLRLFKYMCRVRKGEIWTRENQAEALAATEKKLAEARTKINREADYGEV